MESLYRFFKVTLVICLATAFFILLMNNCSEADQNGVSYEKDLQERASAIFRPMPEHSFVKGEEASEELIELGKMLYYEPRLSRSGLISCHTCHNFGLAGVDNLPVSIGHQWQKGPRNATTVLNAALHSSQFIDGREPDVESQAIVPILNSVEMASTEKYVLAVLNSIPEYVDRFRFSFPDEQEPLTYNNVGVAIGAFERILLTYSPFDSFIKGDLAALDADELSGLETFMDVGCIACHVRETVGGQSFARFLTPREQSGEVDPDLGRFEATGRDEDKHFFKVPSLLNVAETYPYFHDGSEWSLAAAINEVSQSQLSIELSDEELNDLVSFMYALSGEVPDYARLIPILPPSASDTPLPEFD